MLNRPVRGFARGEAQSDGPLVMKNARSDEVEIVTVASHGVDGVLAVKTAGSDPAERLPSGKRRQVARPVCNASCQVLRFRSR